MPLLTGMHHSLEVLLHALPEARPPQLVGRLQPTHTTTSRSSPTHSVVVALLDQNDFAILPRVAILPRILAKVISFYSLSPLTLASVLVLVPGAGKPSTLTLTSHYGESVAASAAIIGSSYSLQVSVISPRFSGSASP